GIRDFHVTGVQTCALPIWYRLYRLGGHGDLPDGPGRAAIDSHGRHPHDELPRKRGKHYPRGVLLSVSFGSDPRWHTYRRTALTKIGRASCRERGQVAVVGG